MSQTAPAPAQLDDLPIVPPNPGEGRFTFIDALRGIAALSVAAMHCYRQFRTSGYARLEHAGPSWLMNPITRVLQSGDLGVDVFFVISGFVMAHALRKAWVTPGYFGNFVLRRSIRLDPPYWVTIAVAALLEFSWLRWTTGAGGLPSWREKHLWAHFLYLQDIVGNLKDNSIVGVFWTLCQEVQFYLVFILLIAASQQIGKACSKKRAPTPGVQSRAEKIAALAIFLPVGLCSLFVVAYELPRFASSSPRPVASPATAASTSPASTSIASTTAASTQTAPAAPRQHRRDRAAPAPAVEKPAGHGTPATPPAKFPHRAGTRSGVNPGLFLFHWHLFFAGVLVQWAVDKRFSSLWFVGFLFAMLGLWFLTDNGRGTRDDHLLIGMITASLIFAVGKAGGLATWLHQRPIQYLGKISYSLYLTHQVVGLKAMDLAHVLTGISTPLASVAYFFLGIAASIASADLLHRCVERPALKLAKRLKTRP